MPLAPSNYTRQCAHAAHSSRLDPVNLHPAEYQLLINRITNSEVPIYLRTRNGILRLWTRNPLVNVSQDEAKNSAKDRAYPHFALLAHEWLCRNGYINFGCVPINAFNPFGGPMQRKIVIVGAGISGLACARHLDGLFRQFPKLWKRSSREADPSIALIEGRNRIGGRVYSHPLRRQQAGSLPHDLANNVELGGQIVTGFERGNPLDCVVRGQLALEYHSMKDDMLLYDYDGSVIGEKRDREINALYDDIIETVSRFGWKPAVKVFPDTKHSFLVPAESQGFPNGIQNTVFPAFARPKSKTPMEAKTSPSLGSMMNDLASSSQRQAKLSPRDMRLLNWHFANLEYANAANVKDLSLGGWDQDNGNEFEGAHAEIIGGYSQLARGLYQYPRPLDIRLNQPVNEIDWDSEDRRLQVSTDGQSWQADQVIVTLPLGVLKGELDNGLFSPPLPSWKSQAIRRMRFGVLNKIVLVFDEIFWERDRDMFGLLNPAQDADSVLQEDYVQDRGRFFLFWNCVKTAGLPVLTALMAGDSAEEAESARDDDLVKKVTLQLAKIFRLPARPIPSEVIITRWRKDPFARGSYSSLGPDAKPDDYEAIARPVNGRLFFAGEATCETHPATVHGAYLSGLRAAAEVFESIVGPVAVPWGTISG